MLGPRYAGVLGLVGFAVVLARGLARGSAAEVTLGYAWLALWALAAIGYVLGRLAERAIQDSVTGQLTAELAAQEARKTAARPPRGGTAEK